MEEEKQPAFHCILSGGKNGGFRFNGILRFYSSTGEIFKSCSLYLIPSLCILEPFPWFILLRQSLAMKINLSKYLNVFQVMLTTSQASLRSPESYH